MIIYKTTNLINGKFYVGKDAKNNPTYLGSGKVLRQSIKKYGRQNFKKEILEECSSLDELEQKEQYWIDKLNAIEKGYNLTKGGTGGNTHLINPHPNWGFKKGNAPWNKGKTGIQTPWNKGVKGYMGANKSSYRPGKDHPFFGKKRDPKIYEKIVTKRKEKNNFKAVGKFAPKRVKNIIDGNVFDSIQTAADFYGLTRDQVGHSCRKQTKTGIFRFINDTEVL